MDDYYSYMPALIVIATVSLWMILSNIFDDNLIQRIGLCLVCFGASLRIYVTLIDTGDLVRPRHILLNGIALFALGTVYKVWRNRK